MKLQNNLTNSPYSYQVNIRINDLIAYYGRAIVEARLIAMMSGYNRVNDVLSLHVGNLMNTFTAYYIIDGAFLSGIELKQGVA